MPRNSPWMPYAAQGVKGFDDDDDDDVPFVLFCLLGLSFSSVCHMQYPVAPV